MHLLWKRYARSGYAPPLLYAAVALAFGALAVWAAAQRDWLVMTIALVMIAVTLAGSRLMRRLNDAAMASRRALTDGGKDDDHG